MPERGVFGGRCRGRLPGHVHRAGTEGRTRFGRWRRQPVGFMAWRIAPLSTGARHWPAVKNTRAARALHAVESRSTTYPVRGPASYSRGIDRARRTCCAPLVLCFLEGRTQDEAAKQLNISKTTLKKRLERGRAPLPCFACAGGLVRRHPGSISWPAAMVSACLPRVLATATVKAATAFVSGQASAGLVSGQVTILVASGGSRRLLRRS